MFLLIILLCLLVGSTCFRETMAYSPSNIDDASQFRLLDPWERTPWDAPTPGYFGRTPTPSERSQIRDEHLNTSQQPQTDHLGFVPLEIWDKERAYDEQPPICIHYLIDWKVTLNNRTVTKVTEPDLVIKPSAFWQQFLREKIEKVRGRKVFSKRRVRLDAISIVASVRSQHDLHQEFDSTDIDWTVIEKQLLMWGNLFLKGKMLRLDISVNYLVDDDNSSPSRNGDKRNIRSVTKSMLAERDAQIDAECSSGQPSIWRDVYRKMRCPGPPCRHEGQYCWLDPVGRKHYKLRTHHMRTLVKYVEQGGTIETHDDIPDTVRNQLYAEEQQRNEKQQKAPELSTSGSILPPININVLPTQGSQPLRVCLKQNSSNPPKDYRD